MSELILDVVVGYICVLVTASYVYLVLINSKLKK